MKATITYVAADGTVQPPLAVIGEKITTQQWDSGRAKVRVYDAPKRGRLVRWLNIRCADLIDVEVDDGA